LVLVLALALTLIICGLAGKNMFGKQCATDEHVNALTKPALAKSLFGKNSLTIDAPKTVKLPPMQLQKIDVNGVWIRFDGDPKVHTNPAQNADAATAFCVPNVDIIDFILKCYVSSYLLYIVYCINISIFLTHCPDRWLNNTLVSKDNMENCNHNEIMKKCDHNEIMKKCDHNEITEKCDHNETMDQIMPQGYIHYSKKICVKCNKFLRWNPNPETIRQFDSRVKLIQGIVNEHEINGNMMNKFEDSFLKSIIKSKHLTPKQNDCWIRICEKYNVSTE
jgi:hypothetical protein